MGFEYHKNLIGAELHVPGYCQDNDPGAVGAGKYWINTSGGGDSWELKVRNIANNGWETMGGGVTDHGALTGLADDDHTQYHNDARANTWLGTKSIEDLLDVIIGSPSVGEILRWSGSEWGNAPITLDNVCDWGAITDQSITIGGLFLGGNNIDIGGGDIVGIGSLSAYNDDTPYIALGTQVSSHGLAGLGDLCVEALEVNEQSNFDDHALFRIGSTNYGTAKIMDNIASTWGSVYPLQFSWYYGTLQTNDALTVAIGPSKYVVYTIRSDWTHDFGLPVYDEPTLVMMAADKITHSTYSIDENLAGKQIFTPSTAQVIDAVGDAILANATMIVLNPDGNYTLTSTPTIADGTTGQLVYITCANDEANTVTIQDQDTLGSSNLQLGAATRAITGKTVLCLMFDGTDWLEVSYAAN